MSLLLIILVLMLLFGGFGYWGRQHVGGYAWSPLGIIVVVLVVLLLAGRA